MTDRHWHAHPAVRSGDDRTLGERAADRMRTGMGSWGFVGGFLVVMLAWAAVNTGALGVHAWDVYPYILLNLLLSTLAGLQGAILLLAAQRADHIAAAVATHTAENTDLTVQLLRQNTLLTCEVRELAKQLHEHVMAST